MAVVKKAKKEEAVKEEIKASRYFYAVGKRKTSIAQVKLYPDSKDAEEIIINDRKLEDYFTISRITDLVRSPLPVAGQDKKFRVSAKVYGGGNSSQAEAVRLGIARALVEFDSELKKPLRDRGFMTRDARKVERKKPGLKKARRAPQWAKR